MVAGAQKLLQMTGKTMAEFPSSLFHNDRKKAHGFSIMTGKSHIVFP